MPIGDRKDRDESKPEDADQQTALKDLRAKQVGPSEQEKVKGGMQRQSIIETSLSN